MDGCRPLSAQVLVAGRGLSQVKDQRRQVSAQDTVYDFLAVPELSSVSPTTLAALGGAVVTVQGVGFDEQPGKTRVHIGGAECGVISATSTRVTCAAPAEQATTPQLRGGAGVLYEVWLDAEVDDLGDLSSLTPDTAGYGAERLRDAAVTNNTFGQDAAFVGRMSGWLRSPRLGQFVLTLQSDGPGRLALGPSPDSLQQSPVAETNGNFDIIKKSGEINMTAGQWTYFEATHKQGSGYRLQVGLIDFDSPVTRDESRAARTDTQTLFIKGTLRHERQVLSFQDWPAAGRDIQLEYNGIVSGVTINTASATGDTWRSAALDVFSARCQYAAVDQAWLQTFEEASSTIGGETE
ncbi:uncharacterized protein LOC119105252 [Pollicipes pollicipes]|uniref:uncharacterized protein LOC119105252 n=1 Tax=Pollicipes pollicipes TaxID=41117 RepID=UPI0018854C09|nr:uncharacterized protein LOC119105252 [Pollicipes pollicipes]